MKTLNLILSFLPNVLAGVVAVEQTIGTSGASGATKKATVLAAVQTAAQVGETVQEQHVSIISHLIDAIVAALNNTGYFTHKAA
jgi:hypothetical protein